MKASDLRLEELVDFSEGRLHLHERRLVLHDIHAFAQYRKDLLDMVGPENARRILTRFGYFWGQADAAAMKRVLRWDSLEEWLKAGPRLQPPGTSTDVAVRPCGRYTGVMSAAYGISHDRREETIEAKTRWFRSLSPEQRMEVFCEFVNLALSVHPDLAERKDVGSFAGRVQVLRKP
jgi:hypothetical protein